MADVHPKLQPNPTRLEDAVLPEPHVPNRLVDDPAYAPALLPSETDAVHRYQGQMAPPKTPARGFDKRLRPFGTLIVALWIGSLTAVAIVRQVRRSHPSSGAK
jgi:hypothetical protein